MTPQVRWRRRTRREVLAKGLVYAGLFAFVVLTYVVVVLGGGALTGQTSSPSLGLSVLATAVVALGFDPVLTRLEKLAARTVLGGRPSPYDVLRRFTAAVTGSYPAEELPERMARVLADGTGALSAQVWVAVHEGRELLAATWPPSPAGQVVLPPDGSPRVRRVEVREGGELLGGLAVEERPGTPLTPVEERLFTRLATQAGLVLRGARLRAELELRATELSARAEELRISRERLVDAQDAERRRLERDIHDGAQQHLVALAVNLRLAHTLAGRAPERAEALLTAQEAAAAEAVEALVQLARGIYPPLLAERGVPAALRAVISGAGSSAQVSETAVGRYSSSAEAAAYFCCLEALQNAAKHAGAAAVRVELRGEPDTLILDVADDGPGFDPGTVTAGSGLANMRDRVESVGGSLSIDSRPGEGTRIHAVLPVRTPTTANGGG